ncbi:hypothetical protein ES705_22322 [subsurface metagenome]
MKPSHEATRYRVERIFDKVTGIISIGLISPAAVALVAWVPVLTVCVIARAFFDVSWMFLEEFTAYLIVLFTFFALSYTLRTEGHIRIDAVTRMLPKGVRNILGLVTTLLSLVIVCYLMQKGIEWFWFGVEAGVHSLFPSNLLLWPVYLFIPIGLATLGLALVHQLYRSVIGLVEGGGKS